MTSIKRLCLYSAMIVAFAHIFYIEASSAADYMSIVHQDFRICCKDKMPSDHKEIMKMKCYFTAAINLNNYIYLFTGNLYWRFNVENKMLHPENNTFTPNSTSNLGIYRYEEVYSVIRRKTKLFVETLFGNRITIFKYDTSKAFTRIEKTLCGYPCAEDKSGSRLPAPFRDVSQGLLVIGSVSFRMKNNSTLTIVPRAKLADPYEFTVDSIKRFRGTSKNSTDQGNEAVGKYHTYAALVVNTTEDTQYYWTFHRFNWACYRKRSVGDDTIIFDYEEKSHTDILPQCIRSQIFFGCPQSFCYNHDVDDFVVSTFNMSTLVVLFRGMYYWLLKPTTSNIPLPLPLVANAMLIGKNDKPWPGLTDLRYIDAAEAFTVNRTEVVLIFKDETVFLIVDGNVEQKRIKELFPSKIQSKVESAWFNRKKKLLFLFVYNLFQTYEVSNNGDRIMFALNGPRLRGIYDEFAGLPAEVTSVLSHLNTENAYFLKDMWYYKVPEEGWQVNDRRKSYTANVTFNPSSKFYETEIVPCLITSKVYEDQYKLKIKSMCKPLPSTEEDYHNTLDIISDVNSIEEEIEQKSGVGFMTFIIIVVTLFIIVVITAVIVAVKYREKLFPQKHSLKKTSSQTTMRGSRENLTNRRVQMKGVLSKIPAGIAPTNHNSKQATKAKTVKNIAKKYVI